MSKKKIGLVLACMHTNYGAQLQSYATQQAVESLGFDTEVIIHKSAGRKHIKFYWGMIPWYINILRKPKKSDRYKNIDADHALNLKKRIENYKRFNKEYMHNINTYVGYSNLCNGGKQCDAVLIGSDQMWIPGVAFGNHISLRFVPDNVRKISYATSCGVSEYPKYVYKSSRDMWRRFDYISTREEQGKKIIMAVCGDIDVKVVLDPTYILTKEEWEQRIPYKRMLEEKYVFCYFLGNNVAQKKYAQQYAASKGVKLVSIMSNESVSPVDMTFSDINTMDASPVEFINWIRGAECVFTDSFHGLAFSVINEVQFYVFYRHQQNVQGSRNSRIDNILKLWELQSRLIANPENVKNITENSPIDYLKVGDKLNNERSYSLDYLKTSLSNL